jgi:hypothetical protein
MHIAAKKRIDKRDKRQRFRSLVQLTAAERSECQQEADMLGVPLAAFLAQMIRAGLECWRDDMGY